MCVRMCTCVCACVCAYAYVCVVIDTVTMVALLNVVVAFSYLCCDRFGSNICRKLLSWHNVLNSVVVPVFVVVFNFHTMHRCAFF